MAQDSTIEKVDEFTNDAQQLLWAVSMIEELNKKFEALNSSVNSKIESLINDVANNGGNIRQIVEDYEELHTQSTTIADELQNEIKARSDAILNVGNRLTTEINRSTTVDEESQTQIKDIPLSMIKHRTEIAETIGELSQRLDTMTTDLESKITNQSDMMDEFETEIKNEVAKLTSSQAYDFIDGGGAPLSVETV